MFISCASYFKSFQINGNSLLDAKHATAVDYFINAGETVKLLVWHGAEKVLVVRALLIA